MKLLKQNNPQCLLYAFAMALAADVEDMIHVIGHDGLEVWWPEASGERRLRGFHHQEMIDYALLKGVNVVMIEAVPNLGCGGRHKIIMEESELQGRMNTYLQSFSGVLVSDKHAVAWCHKEQKCYDPNGYIYGVDAFEIREFFITLKGVANEDSAERLRWTLCGKGSAEANEARGTDSSSGEVTSG
jgi:hypothetical protein